MVDNPIRFLRDVPSFSVLVDLKVSQVAVLSHVRVEFNQLLLSQNCTAIPVAQVFSLCARLTSNGQVFSDFDYVIVLVKVLLGKSLR